VQVRDVGVGDRNASLLQICRVGQRLGGRDALETWKPRGECVLTVDLVSEKIDQIARGIGYLIAARSEETAGSCGRARERRDGRLDRRLEVLVPEDGLITGLVRLSGRGGAGLSVLDGGGIGTERAAGGTVDGETEVVVGLLVLE
jgi:hypothetical protein